MKIDELIVSLALDAAGFTKGQKQTVESLRRMEQQAGKTQAGIDKAQDATAGKTEKAQTRIRRSLRQTEEHAGRTAGTLKAKGREGSEFFEAMTRSALGFLGVLAGIKSFQDVMRLMGNTAATGRAAANIGMPVSQLSRWQLAAQRFAGGSPDATAGSLNGLEQQLQQFKVTGQMSPALIALARLGGSPYASMQSNLLTLAHAFHGMSPAKAMKFGSILGLDTGTINLLEQGRAAVAAHLRAVSPDAMNKAQTAAMIKLQTAMFGVTQAAESLARILTTDMAPGLVRLAHVARDILEGNWKQLNRDAAPAGAKSFTSGISNFLFGNKQASANRLAIMQQLVRGGLSKDAAAGIAGNAQQESSFNPAAKSYDPKSGYHYGLWQLSEDWRRKILAATGIDVAHAGTGQQVKALQWALAHDPHHTLAKLKRAGTANAAGQIFDLSFERSGDGALGQIRRGHYASNALSAYNHHIASERTQAALNLIRGAQMARMSMIHAEHNHAETHIGHVSIDARGKSPQQIASAIRGLGTPNARAMQANTGLN